MLGGTSRDGRLPSLDGIRGIAFLLVFASHAGINHAGGALGVTVFFFLSGYLITTLLLDEERRTGTVRIGAFYLRRAVRILPVFYLVLAAATLVSLAGGLAPDPWPLVAQALNLTNYLFALRGTGGVPLGTDTYWSLAVEEHYYLVFPLAVLLAVRRRVPRVVRAGVVVGLCVAVLAWRQVYVSTHGGPTVYPTYLHAYLATDCRVDGILWGAALALVLDRRALAARLPAGAAAALLPVGVATLVLVTRDAPFTWYYQVPMTTLQALALAVAFTGALVAPPRVLQTRPLVWLGSISYAAYLLHRLVINRLETVLPDQGPAVWVAGLATTLLLAEALRRTVEQPLTRWRARARA